MDSTFNAVRAAALFASSLQPSQDATPVQVRRAVATTLRRLGLRGCEAGVAAEFGEHPEVAAPRMTWALDAVRDAYIELAAHDFAYAG